MKKNDLDRRDFLKGAAVGGVAAASVGAATGPTETAQAQQLAPAANPANPNAAGYVFLRDFVEEAKASGLVARLIERHNVVGRLSVAPRA